MLGFTYNGIHSSTYGLYYTPNADDRWFKDPEYDVYDTDMEWRHGGYYYDSKAKNRTFTIKCLFEEIDVATRQKIKQWLRMGSVGELIFDDMPFVYWKVRPGKIPVGNWYLDTNESHSGTVTITFTAYEPFGYLTRKSNGSGDTDNANDYCNLISTGDMPAAPTTSSTSFDIYNPGTETCGLTIELAGSSSNPIRFINERNSTACELNSLPTGGITLRVDGDTGCVNVYTNNVYDNGFAYHDRGFIRLEPNVKYTNVDYTYTGTSGTTYTFTLTGVHVDESIIGAKVTLTGVSNTTFTIIDINRSTNGIYCTRTGSGTPGNTGKCSFETVNHIAIQEKPSDSWTTPSTLSLTSISVDYAPKIL